MDERRTASFEKEVGFVTSAKEYLLFLEGLPSARIDDLLRDENGHRAIVRSIGRDYVEALMLDRVCIRPGTHFFLEGSGAVLSIGDHMFGRIINALGAPIDGGSSFPKPDTPLNVHVVAGGIAHREHITRQFETGIALVDTLFPIGKGQRQLLFGPIRSGKNEFIKDVIINQQGRDTICMYVAIGKPIRQMQDIASRMYAAGANAYTITIGALSTEPSPVIALAPSTALIIAEHYSAKGRNVLIVFDDLATHAKYLREIALLEERLPGRESYPGDIFYQHAHLMERAGQFNKKAGGGSITILPLLETGIEDFTDLIPTNLMACTDGHFSFSPGMQAEGYYPSIRPDQSVTRVGRKTQPLAQKQLATKTLALLAEYRRQSEYAQFGSEISARTKKTLEQGAIIRELLRQEPFENISAPVQVMLLSLAFTDLFASKDLGFVQLNKRAIKEALRDAPELKEARTVAVSDISLKQFLERFKGHMSIIERVCQS